MQWNIIETPPASAEENMEKDRQLLMDLGTQINPILHLYNWKNLSITFGHFVQIEKVLRVDRAKGMGIDLAKRPTGGGVVFHLWDLAFSVLVPTTCPIFSENPLKNYACINRVIQRIAIDFLKTETNLMEKETLNTNKNCSNFCMAHPTKYDVVIMNKKIAGAAQRKTRHGFLHQGTIALIPSDKKILSELLEEEICQAIEQSTFPLFKNSQELENRRDLLKKKLKLFFNELNP
jgi:lipoate---protein ligase